ncbi:hypothetical protein TVAG_033250 [Trichomonas vaginalis G3]|uniref:Uncharacterized protein n=1 Tax=Trichomonas vaginalis (strain ATCC PRA-98 / G3) TaxID=412133 RepID=A2FIZ0_TRIV3|nr:hypothetical protein TVAG_033250 [Trichomonas vaginalis G3]|eukprot:XP_001308035.1 hypothetical protein [Trichomonas vaginalis G3]
MRESSLQDELIAKPGWYTSNAQLRIYKAYLKILFDIRFHRLGFYISTCFGILMILLCLTIPTKSDAMNTKDEKGHYKEFDSWSVREDIKDFSSIEDFYEFRSIYYPRNDLTTFLANYSNYSRIFDDESEFDNYSTYTELMSIKVDKKEKYFYNISTNLNITKNAWFGGSSFSEFTDTFVKEITRMISKVRYNYYGHTMSSFERTNFIYVFIEWLVTTEITVSFIRNNKNY